MAAQHHCGHDQQRPSVYPQAQTHALCVVGGDSGVAPVSKRIIQQFGHYFQGQTQVVERGFLKAGGAGQHRYKPMATGLVPQLRGQRRHAVAPAFLPDPNHQHMVIQLESGLRQVVGMALRTLLVNSLAQQAASIPYK